MTPEDVEAVVAYLRSIRDQEQGRAHRLPAEGVSVIGAGRDPARRATFIAAVLAPLACSAETGARLLRRGEHSPTPQPRSAPGCCNEPEDFNAGRKAKACDLFSKDVLSDFRGQGETGYAERCRLLERAIEHDPARDFHYEPLIKEILVEGDLAVVRLEWKLTITPGDIVAIDLGMDIFRKEADGRWCIIRYIAYEEEGAR